MPSRPTSTCAASTISAACPFTTRWTTTCAPAARRAKPTPISKPLLKDAIPALSKKTTLGASEDGYIKQAAAAALLAQLYFNAVAYIGEEHFDECAEICRDIIGGVYGTYELDKTWYGPHCFDNNTSPR